MLKKTYYPFTEVVEQNDIKQALILNLINPKIGGVIINGGRGTAKSTLVRSLVPLVDCPFIEVPVSVSEDCLCGSIDLERTLKDGKVSVSEGLLAKANGGILYIDEINLLPDNISDLLIQTLSSGEIKVEREGISNKQKSSFIVIGTMNSEQGDIRPQLIDHFGLFAQAQEIDDVGKRVEVVRRIASFEADPLGFSLAQKDKETELLRSIKAAQTLLKKISITDENLDYIISSCIEAGVEGHRADLVMVQTAMAVAAFHGRSEVSSQDIDEAAYFVLPHRRNLKSPPPMQDQRSEDNNSGEHQGEETDSNGNDNDSTESAQNQPSSESGGNSSKTSCHYNGKKQAAKIGNDFKVISFSHRKDRKVR
ncbi:MAG: AAA domain-containing protein, partial [Clostridiales bacterium]|nr:AAA domain-containing protein [Clostridiales bacterium]